MASNRSKASWPVILAALVLLLAVGGVIAAILLPKPQHFEPHPDKPLLGDGPFRDDQTGICCEPPPGWVMQVRSREGGERKPERTLVKYKRFSTDEPPAWIRVRLVEAGSRELKVYLETRKPPEPGFVREGGIRMTEFAGRPAFSATWKGEYSSDGRSVGPHSSDVTVTPLGDRFLEIASTWKAGDEKTAKEIELFLKSVKIE